MVSMDGKMIFAIGMMINVFLFLGQVGVTNINKDAPRYYNYKGSIVEDFDSGNKTLDQDFGSDIQDEGGTTPDEGNVFTDPFTELKTFIQTADKYTGAFLTAFPDAISNTGLPQEITYALSVMWYGVAAFALILIVFGRN